MLAKRSIYLNSSTGPNAHEYPRVVTETSIFDMFFQKLNG